MDHKKNIKQYSCSLFAILLLSATTACKKITDVLPISNEVATNYYRDYKEVNIALTGCYNGLQEPLLTEWMLTELRSDNARQRSVNSTTNTNMELNVLNLYTASAQHQQIYNYWLSVYKNIRNINYVLRSLGIKYENNQLVYGQPSASVSNTERDELAGQALFLRAYHYFNLVRLYGGVFLVTAALDPSATKTINRSSLEDCYQLIVQDLQAAANIADKTAYPQISTNNLGKANAWSAKALLAKVYLSLSVPRKTEALDLLNDIIANSGYGMENSFDRVFSISNEMNKEILFAVRYKAGLVGLGNPMPNLFGPASSGDAVINGDGSGFNYPTTSINGSYTSSPTFSDARKAVTIANYSNSTTPLYVNKFFSKVIVKDDAENDFTIIRYADVILMKAEAQGYNGPAGTSVGLINQIRERAGAGNYTSGVFAAAFYKYPSTGDASLSSESAFITALLKERRLEFAFENQRLFDMIRLGQAITLMQAHYAAEYSAYYGRFRPIIPLTELQANVNTQRLILPIPQREIDTNTEIQIAQNPGY
ncbi:SusD family protein [compost metagenome]